ncbi:TetR/AcrR family transcriptional regulator [Nonomuraea sp. NBC_01738]|uniref:TetR/AcrR family transcriptional regulator n=1 Tax=Nonomuraea sp. NBC_01738 TaxID=2976003 RepID=UPI002E0E3B90|nr:TetR/AcrR family transcriptional regulator [Nonomuraea sp. NBC_01738]
METPGRRERKKAETRQRISDHGSVLFYERGFDNVTIGEIAEAADVSKVTVFNYFPRKEDIFFDRVPELIALLTATVRDREPGTPVLEAIRRMLIGHAESGHPLGGVDERYAHFWRVVADSPALRARAREIAEEIETVLAELIAESGDDLPAPLAAAMLVGGYRAAYLRTARRLMAGQGAAEVAKDHVADVNAAFDALTRAFAVERG